MVRAQTWPKSGHLADAGHIGDRSTWPSRLNSAAHDSCPAGSSRAGVASIGRTSPANPSLHGPDMRPPHRTRRAAHPKSRPRRHYRGSEQLKHTSFREDQRRYLPGRKVGLGHVQQPPVINSIQARRIAPPPSWSPTALGEQVLGYYELAAEAGQILPPRPGEQPCSHLPDFPGETPSQLLGAACPTVPWPSTQARKDARAISVPVSIGLRVLAVL
jgi:hypothetical protein